MAYRYLRLQHGPKAWAVLREVRGADEISVDDANTLTAILLLDRLLVPLHKALPDYEVLAAGLPAGAEALAPGQAAELTADDRDRLLGAVYQELFGGRVESRLHCDACGAWFEMDFGLLELQASLEEAAGLPGLQQEADGSYRLASGVRFRLPTGRDELAISQMAVTMGERELLRRCLLDGLAETDSEAVQAAMQRLAPVIDLDLEAQCPECGAAQVVHFDLQTYLLSAVSKGRAQLHRQVHRLARTYGWSLAEILALSRRQRTAYVELIESEAVRA